MALAPAVHQRIARSAVPALLRPVGMQDREVGDATDIEQAQGLTRLAEPGAVKEGGQRRTLPARRHIAAAKVGHDIDAGEFGQQGRLTQLNRVAGAVKGLGAMAHGLTMRTDGPHLGRGPPAAIEQ